MRLNKSNVGMLFFVTFLLLASLPLSAGDTDRIGTAAGVQAVIPVGARDLAMAGANIVYTDGVDAIFWNPAGLSVMDNSASGLFSTQSYIADIKIHYMALGFAAGFGNIGINIKALDFGSMPITTIEDMDGISGQTYSPTFTTIGLTYANKLTSSIHVGLTGKMIYESIPNATASAFAFDIGLQYMDVAGIEGFSFGVVMKNIGTKMQYEGSGLLTRIKDDKGISQDVRRTAASDQLPASMDIGLAYKTMVMEKGDLLLAGSYLSNNLSFDEYKLGAEFEYDKMFALRMGYVIPAAVQSENVLFGITLGAGVSFDLGGTKLGVNYAYRDVQYFESGNVFDLCIGF